MIFWDNFKKACEERNLKPTPVLKECGISTGSIGRWQSGSSPNADAVIAIARYLNCSTDSLLMGSEFQNDAMVCVNDYERNLITMFREIPDPIRNFVYSSVKTAYDSEITHRESAERLLG